MMADPRSVLVVPEPTGGCPCADAELLRRSADLAQDAGGPAIRAVIFVAPDSTEPQAEVLTQYPRLIARMSRAQALAHSAPVGWRKFLVIHNSENLQAASLMTRTEAGFVESRIECKAQAPALLEAALRCFGVDKCLVAGEDAVPAPWTHLTIERAAQTAVEEGALAFASERLSARGVSVTNRKTTLHATRRIAYSVLHPERHVFDPADPTLAEVAGARPLFIVFDRRAGSLYARQWRRYAEHRDLQVVGELALDSSERSKSWRQVDEICAAAARAKLARNALLLGIGGGVTLDVAGLAASLFRRGIDYVRIPTTLVGMVDVAVGIKQGVNAHGRKNLIGTFYPPLVSINDYRFLRTLGEREIACGSAEIVKMAALRDAALFHMLETHAPELLQTQFSAPASAAVEVTRRAELLMLEELAPNLFEEERARLVDFGHTFSPAIEIASRFDIPHGYAVALDMLLSTALAATIGLASVAWLRRLEALCRAFALPVWEERILSTDQLLASMDDIRRHRGGALNLVVVSEPAMPHFIASVSRGQLAAALELLSDPALSPKDTPAEIAASRYEARCTAPSTGGYARAAV